MITSIDAEKAFDEIQYPFIIIKKKKTQQSDHRGNILIPPLNKGYL